jgi:hypothetical protein
MGTVEDEYRKEILREVLVEELYAEIDRLRGEINSQKIFYTTLAMQNRRMLRRMKQLTGGKSFGEEIFDYDPEGY